MNSPKDVIRARIFEIIAQEDSLLGDVWRLHQAGIPPFTVDWDSPEWMKTEGQSPTHLDLGETDPRIIRLFNDYVAEKLQISVRKSDDFLAFFRSISGDGHPQHEGKAGCCIRLLRDFKTHLDGRDCAEEIDYLMEIEHDLLKLCPHTFEWELPTGFHYRNLIANDVNELKRRLLQSLLERSDGKDPDKTQSERIKDDAVSLVARQEGTTPEVVRRQVRLTEIGWGGGSSVWATPAGWRG